MRTSDQKLTRDFLRDLVTDIRCARQDGYLDYAKDCEVMLRLLWKDRHVVRIGRYGMPFIKG
jgi:hypothetical protein